MDDLSELIIKENFKSELSKLCNALKQLKIKEIAIHYDNEVRSLFAQHYETVVKFPPGYKDLEIKESYLVAGCKIHFLK